MRILLTGCAGFIGWRVTELLLREGHTVVGVDNLNDSYDTGIKKWRFRQLQAQPGFRFHRLDITDPQAVGSHLGQESFDVVFNLAARAGIRQSVKDPVGFIDTNVVGTLNLLELAREKGIGKFVLASTSSVYGDGPCPFREDSPTDRPLSPYAATKKAAELLCYVYHRLYEIDVTVLRYFTVYGPAGRPDMSIFRFAKWIAGGEPVILYGDGHQERDFTYVDDIARGTVLATRPLGYQVINLGAARPVPLHSVITLLEELMGRKADIQRQLPRPADALATSADITKAKKLLGWQPMTSIEEGLAQTVAWHKQNWAWIKDISLGDRVAR